MKSFGKCVGAEEIHSENNENEAIVSSFFAANIDDLGVMVRHRPFLVEK